MKASFPQSSLATRLVALARHPGSMVMLFALAMVAALWGAIVHEIHQDRADALEEWTRNLGNLTLAFEEHTLRTFAAVEQDTKYVRNQYLRQGNKLDLRALSREGGISDHSYDSIGVVDAYGMYSHSNRHSEPVYLGDREYFQAQADNRHDTLFISQPVMGRVFGRWTVHVTRRITLPDGSFGGVVVASLDPAYLASLFNEVDLGVEGVVTLLGNDGVIRARRSDGRLTVGQKIDSQAVMKDSLNVMAGSYLSPGITDGIMRLYTYRRLPSYPLTVVVGVSTQRIYERSDQRRDGYLLIGSVATPLILLLALQLLRVLRRQSRTVERLDESRSQAESANRLKSEFLASMSHELRTPLNGILGSADILRRRGLDEKSRRYGEVIHASGGHLLAILNSILDLAKIEAGKMEVHPREEELRPLFMNTVQIHQATAGNKELVLDVEIADDLPARFVCDAMLLRQVLNNLVNNAIKFTEKGGVSVRASRATGTAQPMLRVEVADTGIGVAQDALDLVFEKFRQADQSATRTHQGTGLGLTLAKQLVNLMGGEIGITSAQGLGTTLYFTLPLQAGAALPAAAAAATPAATPATPAPLPATSAAPAPLQAAPLSPNSPTSTTAASPEPALVDPAH